MCRHGRLKSGFRPNEPPPSGRRSIPAGHREIYGRCAARNPCGAVSLSRNPATHQVAAGLLVHMAGKSREDQKKETLLPFPIGQLFQLHGNEIKLHPVCHLSQASVLCITHCMLFFGVCKNAFNGLSPPLVKIPVLWCAAGVIRQVLVILPDMLLHRFDAALGMGTQLSGRTVGAYLRIALVFPVAVPVCSGIFEDLVFRANHAIIEFIIDILPPFVAALHRHGTFADCGKDSAIIKYLLADMGRLVSRICSDAFCFRKGFCYLVIYLIKGCAVVNIAGCYYCFRYKAIFVTGRMGFICKLSLMLSFYEQSAVRVCGALYTVFVFLASFFVSSASSWRCCVASSWAKPTARCHPLHL